MNVSPMSSNNSAPVRSTSPSSVANVENSSRRTQEEFASGKNLTPPPLANGRTGTPLKSSRKKREFNQLKSQVEMNKSKLNELSESYQKLSSLTLDTGNLNDFGTELAETEENSDILKETSQRLQAGIEDGKDKLEDLLEDISKQENPTVDVCKDFVDAINLSQEGTYLTLTEDEVEKNKEFQKKLSEIELPDIPGREVKKVLNDDTREFPIQFEMEGKKNLMRGKSETKLLAASFDGKFFRFGENRGKDNKFYMNKDGITKVDLKIGIETSIDDVEKMLKENKVSPDVAKIALEMFKKAKELQNLSPS